VYKGGVVIVLTASLYLLEIPMNKLASAITGQGALATVNRPLTGTKIFLAVLLANIVTILIAFFIVSTMLSVERTNDALDRANQMGRQN
jgi:hypothetical protein